MITKITVLIVITRKIINMNNFDNRDDKKSNSHMNNKIYNKEMEFKGDKNFYERKQVIS